jgi:hypothetical protein
MRAKTVEVMKKIQALLLESPEYLPAVVLAEKCHLPLSAVYRVIRLMREEGIGVHNTPSGYILSEFATKPDDTHFLRRLNGRRTSDYFSINAAAPHIKKRWKGVEDKRNLGLIMGPLNVDVELLSAGLTAIKALEDMNEI